MATPSVAASGVRPASWADAKKYLWPMALAVPVLPFAGYGLWHRTGLEVFWWVTPFVVFVIVPVIDLIMGSDTGNPPDDAVPALERAHFYRWMTYLYLPLQYAGLVLACWVWSHDRLGPAGMAGVAFTAGTVSGIAINTAHELGHKREEVERWLSKIALAPSGYGHFYVEHNRGHHVRVATPEDPASSRLGESFYRFWPRTVFGSVRSAWRLETKRFTIRNRSWLTIRNDLFSAWAMTVVIFGALVAWLGFGVLPLLVAQAVIGFSLLEVVNYLEHYGLRRQLNAAGRYEKVDPRHSWNSDRLATNIFLYQLQRHSDHHANPTRRYQVLRSFDVSPQLPAGYATMIVVALVPPIWRRIMDPRVAAHYDGDVSLANRR